MPFARLMPVQAPRPWYRLQHYYIWALYCVMGLRWQTVGDVSAFARGSIGTSALRLPRRWDLVGLIGGKVIFISWAIVVPLLFYPWWAVLGAYLAYSMVVSLIMAVTFQLAHCVEEADFASPEDLAGEPRLWAVHEVETTVNFCPRNRRPELAGRRSQLPDRAPSVPSGAAHALPADRRDRPAQRRAARSALRGAAFAARGPSVALPAPADDGADGRAGRARDGLSAAQALRSAGARDSDQAPFIPEGRASCRPALWLGAGGGVGRAERASVRWPASPDPCPRRSPRGKSLGGDRRVDQSAPTSSSSGPSIRRTT